jgi:tetratricopeptide (TPR) repeat protein
LARHPNNGAAWAFIGLSEFELRNYDDALSALEKARSSGVGDNAQLVAVTRYTLAILLNRSGKFDDAHRELEALARQGQQNSSIVDPLGMSVLLLPYLPSQLPPDNRDLVNLAGRAALETASNHRNEAGILYREMISRYPSTANVHYAFGVFLLPDKPDQAIAEFRRELAITPSHIPAHLQLLAEFLRRSDYDAALPLAREATAFAPDAFLPKQMLGRSLLETGDISGAIKELQLSAKLEPNDPQTHFQLARAYRQAGQRDDAARENAEFLRLDRAQKALQYGAEAVGGAAPKLQ